ncbi:MAG: basic amino acid ABC transporter substrate-binding protein [Chloroflexota bacterium]|nr:basic amino acid ABC transporter substrate-binding protein [Chloroflexota bacterium]
MRERTRVVALISILTVLATLVVACGPPATEEPAVEPTEEPIEEPTEEPVEEPTEPPAEEGLGLVTIGTNAEYPPFEFVDDEGNITGFDIDLMTAIAEEAGFEFEFVNTRWDGIFVALASGEFDAVISAATITEEREEMVDFSDPYFNAGQRIAVRADETEIEGPEDLAGKRVGVQLGTTGDIWLTDETEAEVVRYDENTLAFQALDNGDVDAAAADGPTVVDIIQANPEMDLKVLDGVYTEEQYGIAVNPDRQDLLEAINQGLAAVKESGKYDEIYDKYFGVEEAEEGEPVDLGLITIGTNAEYPPFEYVDDEGNITGFDIDLMTAIAGEAGFEFEFVNTRWDGIFVALASGEFDAVISAATITEEREEMVDFSDPYFNAGQMIAVRADETEIEGPEDLAGKRVGVQLGTTGDIWLTDETEAEVVRYDENTLAFQALANGDVDAAVADGPTAADIIRANPEMNLTLVEGVYTEEQYGVAVNPDRQDLLEAINAGLAAVKESGKYDEIYDTYFGTD